MCVQYSTVLHHVLSSTRLLRPVLQYRQESSCPDFTMSSCLKFAHSLLYFSCTLPIVLHCNDDPGLNNWLERTSTPKQSELIVVGYTLYNIKVSMMLTGKNFNSPKSWCDSSVAIDLHKPLHVKNLGTSVLLVENYIHAQGGAGRIRPSPTISDRRSKDVAAMMTSKPESCRTSVFPAKVCAPK